ncbi:PEP-CTERM sorting domain-containing protein [Bythopirellula polymerisocia]|uniref:Ice-binding protein C-terminal domain-containing protein n=1 Tax=Bythopirellula polymerisocia TaxID=2528003 RepID=A0A5C6D5G6_9BACT|nr:PEP-CTERM sorting domain-containing protein [Bythopirellula polymerisocia]TWU30466.1 hypothetical protein Pla144_12530 [Bythopirellula polymerisocia]
MRFERSLKKLAERLFAGSLVCCVASMATAGIVVNDTWRDGTDSDPAVPTYSENGVDSDLDGDIESMWFDGGTTVLDPTGPGGPLRGTVSTSSASWTSYFTPEGSEVELANPGDSLKLTWAFSMDAINASNTSQNLRVALVDSPASARLVASGAPGSDAYSGYGMFINMGQTLGRDSAFRLMERSGASGNILSSSGDWATVADAPGISTGNAGYTDGTTYTLEMMITRTAAGLLDVTSTMTGAGLNGTGSVSVSAAGLAPNNGSFKFDTFSLRPSNAVTTAAVFDTSLFKVEHCSIPEPASLVLLGLSAMAMGCRRQR